MFCQYKSYSASISDILPIGVTFCNHVIFSLTVSFDILFCSVVLLCSADSIYPTAQCLFPARRDTIVPTAGHPRPAITAGGCNFLETQNRPPHSKLLTDCQCGRAEQANSSSSPDHDRLRNDGGVLMRRRRRRSGD